MATEVSFDGNDLQTASILISNMSGHDSMPEKEMERFSLAFSNSSTVMDPNYPSRTIQLSGKIIGTSISDLDSKLDTFKAYFRGKEKNLDIDHAGGTRRYIASLNSMSIDRPNGLSFANFDIEFFCSNPFGKATSSTSALSASARTLGSYTDSHTFIGTAPYQLPVITITLNTVTGGTGHLSFSNDDTGQSINITGQSFVDDDVIEIDCVNKTVKLNGAEIDFMGAFPEFEPGSHDFTYGDGFATRNFDINVDYYALYL